MKDIFVKDILKQCNGKLIYGNENEICENFSKDTRQINKGDIYLGIKGSKFNGSIFYKEALKNGAKGCILQDIKISAQEIKEYKGKFIIIVKDVVDALQKLAQYKRNLYKDLIVIGITGSVGKTSTKDMVYNVLNTKYNVLKTEGNYNNEIGLPLTILKLKEQNAMVLEMGMSSLGEISLLTKIAKLNIAIITTIGSSHIGELGSRENILKAKLEIIEGLNKEGTLIINNDNDLLNRWNKDNNDLHKHITYGIENKSNIVAKNINVLENKSIFEIEEKEKKYKIEIPASGKHFIYNTLAAIAVGKECKIETEKIIKGITQFNTINRRMQIIKLKSDVTIINDTYNSSYESVKAALEYVSSLSSQRKIAVLGDILELGKFSKEIHKSIGKDILEKNIDIVITVGSEAININKEVNNKIENYSFEKNLDATNFLKNIIKTGDIILIKASNGMNFNEIVEDITKYEEEK